jgi:hypothetical protein
MGTKIKIPDDLAADLAFQAELRGISVEEHALEILRSRALDSVEYVRELRRKAERRDDD